MSTYLIASKEYLWSSIVTVAIVSITDDEGIFLIEWIACKGIYGRRRRRETIR